MPREIFFQSAEEKGALECYASRLPLDSDKLLNTPWPFKRTHLNVEFPLPATPDTDAKTSLLLETWALTPFFSSESGQIEARIVPDALCKACIGESNLATADQPIPPHWPEGGPDFNAEAPPPPPPPMPAASSGSPASPAPTDPKDPPHQPEMAPADLSPPGAGTDSDAPPPPSE